MKRIIAVIAAVLIFTVYTNNAVALYDTDYSIGNPDTSNWFEWDLPDDVKAKGTAIDASFMLHAPAGKHGFVKSNGNKIQFEDGTPARFWGTNVGGQGIFQTKEDARRLAERLARVGYNLVRIHSLDGVWYANNIFGFVNGNTTTRALCEEQLDMFFYLCAQLKEQGVYLYIDLLCYRAGNVADDEIPFGAEELGSGWKPESVFDPYLIELQKEFAYQLLTPVNPYTGLSLKDDPAVVAVSMHNENAFIGIGSYGKGGSNIKTSYYASTLQSMFNRWLQDKYNSRHELEQAWCEEGKTGLESAEDYDKGTVVYKDTFETLNYSWGRLMDIYDFNLHIQTTFYTEFRAYLENEVGVKCFISGLSVGLQWGFCPGVAYAVKDTVEIFATNGYKSHPSTGVGFPGTITPWITPTLRSGLELFQHFPVNRIYNMPYFFTEWQACSPSHHAAEHYMMMAVLASVYDMNPVNYGMVQYPLPNNDTGLRDFFETFQDPMHTGIQTAAAITFLRDEIVQPRDVHYRTINKEDFMHPRAYYNWNITPWNVWAFGKIENKYPELGDDVSESTAEALDRMYKKFDNNEPQTEQIDWNMLMGLYRLDTDYTNAAFGYVGDLKIDLSYCIFEVENQAATVTINSLTEDTLQDSNRLLLSVVGRSRNKGMEMDDETGQKIISKGSGPLIAEPIIATVTIKETDDISVYALDSSGQRTAQLETFLTSDGLVKFNTQAEYKTMHYEICKGGKE